MLDCAAICNTNCCSGKELIIEPVVGFAAGVSAMGDGFSF